MDKFPIYKMIIDDNSETGLNAVALVDQPAIERMWMKFNAEIFIEPQAGETQSEFLSRCIPAMIDEGKEQDQAIAMCISMYDGKLEQIDREQKLKFGGEGSGCHGDNCGRPKGSDNEDIINEDVKKVVNDIENGEPPTVSKLMDLYKKNPEAASIIEDIAYNNTGAYKELDKKGKKIFDKMTTKKDYELYRVDSRYNSNDLQIGDNLDFEKSPTFVASDVNYVKNLSASRGNKNPSIIIFEKGTRSIKHRPRFENGSHEVIRGTFKVSKIEEDKIYVKQIKPENFNKKHLFSVVNNEERRIVTGPLMIANLPIYRKGADGFEFYVVFDAATIEQLVMKYHKDGFQHSVNLMHNGQQVEGVYMFESFIIDKQRGITAPTGFDNIPDGSWFGSYKIENDEVWNLIKAGTFKGFSVEGFFLKKLITATDEQVINKLKEILS